MRQMKPTRAEKEKATRLLKDRESWVYRIHPTGAVWTATGTSSKRYVVSMAEHRAFLAAAHFLQLDVSQISA